MKKYHFIALAVCCGFLWACQKDGPTENPFADAPWAIDETLPVPIQVNAPTPQTKSNAITSLEGVRLKVLAYDTVNGGGLMLGKELCAIGADGENANLQFYNDTYTQTDTYYYPFTSTGETRKNFTFFAYHAPASAEGGFAEEDSDEGNYLEGDYVVTFPLNPTTNEDILVATATATPYSPESHILNEDNSIRYSADSTYYGFNARYQRVTRLVSNSVMTDHQPVLNFSHAAARIIINVKAKDATAQTQFAASGRTVQLTEFLQANAREKVSLNLTNALGIANYEDPALQALVADRVLSWDTNSSAITTAYELSNTVAPARAPTTTAVALHTDDSWFIVPGNDAITITYVTTNSTTPEGQETKITKPLVVPEDGYLPGHTYTYTLVIDSDESVTITTNLADWVPGSFGSEQNPNITED